MYIGLRTGLNMLHIDTLKYSVNCPCTLHGNCRTTSYI